MLHSLKPTSEDGRGGVFCLLRGCTLLSVECIVKASLYKHGAIYRGGRCLCRRSSDLCRFSLLEPFKSFGVYLDPINNLLVFANLYFL